MNQNVLPIFESSNEIFSKMCQKRKRDILVFNYEFSWVLFRMSYGAQNTHISPKNGLKGAIFQSCRFLVTYSVFIPLCTLVSKSTLFFASQDKELKSLAQATFAVFSYFSTFLFLLLHPFPKVAINENLKISLKVDSILGTHWGPFGDN